MKHLFSVLGAGAVLLLATPARAQDPPESEERVPAFAASRAGGFVALWPTRNNFSAIVGGELQLGIAKGVLLDLSYAGAFARVGDAPDAGDNLGYGNPILGVRGVGRTSDVFHYFVGVSVAPPVLQDPSQEVANAAFYGQRMLGYYEADRFARGHLAARVSVGMQWRPVAPLFVTGELRPVVFIPTNAKYPVIADDRLDLPGEGSGRTEVLLEHALEIEGRTDMGLGFGARLQAVGMMMRDDRIQLTAEPFIGLTPRRKGLYARVGVPIAIDEDLGPGFETDKLVGVRLHIGAQW